MYGLVSGWLIPRNPANMRLAAGWYQVVSSWYQVAQVFGITGITTL
jgi:hypothetical protein